MTGQTEPAAKPQGKLFLSYARDDDKAFVERLYKDLKNKGFDVWWDKESMPSRGLSFLQEIRDATNAVEKLILVVGPAAAKSDYVQAEWQYALSVCIPVIPILRISQSKHDDRKDYKLIPAELQVHAPDFREPRPYEKALEELLRILAQPAATLGALYGVPPLPNWYIERADDLRALVQAVCQDTRQPIVITSKQQTVALVGLGGIGKTTLAKALSRDCEVRRVFPDGIFWLELGKAPSLATCMRDVGVELGDSRDEYPDVQRGQSRLGKLLSDKAALLVLDDVWDHQHVEAFRVVGNRCRLVVTTRQTSIANKLGIPPQTINTLTEDEGLALIGRRLERDPAAPNPNEQTERALVRLLGGHTLAISIAAAILAEPQHGPDYAPKLLENLQKRGPLELTMDEKDKNYNLELSLAESYDALKPDMQQRFRGLGVFAEEGTFDAAALRAVWGDADGYVTNKALDVLIRAGLLTKDGERYRQHNLLRAYARALLARENEIALYEGHHFAHYKGVHVNPDTNGNVDRHPLITLDFENIRAALTWGFEHAPEHACDWAFGLNYYLGIQNRHNDRVALMTAGRDAAIRVSYTHGQANCIFSLGEAHVRVAEYSQAQAYYEDAWPIYHDIGGIAGRRGEANCIRRLGGICLSLADYSTAQTHYKKALLIYRKIGSTGRRGEANCIRGLGDVHLKQGEYSQARKCYEKALLLYNGYGLGKAHCIKSLGDIHLYLAEYPQAQARYEEALSIYSHIRDRLGEAGVLVEMGRVRFELGDHEGGMRDEQQAAEIYEAIGNRQRADIARQRLAEMQ